MVSREVECAKWRGEALDQGPGHSQAALEGGSFTGGWGDGTTSTPM